MKLDNANLKKLRSIGHHLSPIVMISNGLSENIVKEVNRALADHELIKVKIQAPTREEKQQQLTALCKESGAETVQLIGHVALLYKAAAKPKPKLSNILRFKTD